MLLAVELPQEEYHYVSPGLLLLAVEPCRKDLRVVEYEGVTLPEIIYDVLE